MNTALGVQLFSYGFRDPATDEPLALGTVTTTLAGTSSLVATFADAALSASNTNPLTLDTSGYGVMFFSPLNATTSGVSYDVVVKDVNGVVKWTFEDVSIPIPTATGNATTFVWGAGDASTLTIAGGSITPTKNVHLVTPEGGAADNLDTIAITAMPDGARLTVSNTNGSAAITVRNNQGNIFTSDGQSVVLSTTAQRLSLIRYGANWFVDNAVATAAAQINTTASGRLTLTTAVPVTTTDVTAAGTVYYTPYLGNVIDLYDGTATWTRYTFAELSLALTLAADGVMDIFAFNNGGVVALATNTWTNATTRAVALTRQNGVLVLSSNTAFRYLGTVGATSVANQCEDSLTSRLVWNYYNRVPRPCRRLEPTASWAYTTASFRQANASTSNQIKTLTGVVEDDIDLMVSSRAQFDTAANSEAAVSIGLDSTTTPTAGLVTQGNQISNIGTAYWTMSARLVAPTTLGRHLYTWLELGTGVGTLTWYGQSGQQQSGLVGRVMG